MNRDEVARIVTGSSNIEVMKAWVEEKTVQVRVAPWYEWADYEGDNPTFEDPSLLWRVKPVPRHFWVIEHEPNDFEIFASHSDLVSYWGIERAPLAFEVVEVVK